MQSGIDSEASDLNLLMIELLWTVHDIEDLLQTQRNENLELIAHLGPHSKEYFFEMLDESNTQSTSMLWIKEHAQVKFCESCVLICQERSHWWSYCEVGGLARSPIATSEYTASG
ncbi:MAG TPA: hypothetical protein VK828_11585 [Terriglobales bacterium]|nr:hypothetical protein [Terriglobales bacterium]